jgi:type II secretory pathway pseudopilin PulG
LDAVSSTETRIGRGIEPLERWPEAADSLTVRKLLRREGGFGLIELLLAMTMLNIGLLAVVAAFSSGIVSLNRASRITTAAVLADGQMELYRALTYAAIRLEPSSIPTIAPYTTDTAYDPSQVTAACAGPPAECNASRQAIGADGKTYRLDTYIVSVTPTGGRPVKKVTVVVRDYNNLTVTFARQVSTFDQSTG